MHRKTPNGQFSLDLIAVDTRLHVICHIPIWLHSRVSVWPCIVDVDETYKENVVETSEVSVPQIKHTAIMLCMTCISKQMPQSTYLNNYVRHLS